MKMQYSKIPTEKADINRRKEDLLDDISARLEQKEEVDKLLTIKWRVR